MLKPAASQWAHLWNDTRAHVHTHTLNDSPFRLREGERCTGRMSLTSFIGVHLGLQILGGHIEVGLLVHGGPRFTFTTAAVTTATQATAEVTTSCQATEDKQGLSTTRQTAVLIQASSAGGPQEDIGHRPRENQDY